MSGDLVDTTEMYLKAIYELEEEGVPPLRARLVERLGQSKPTVSETVARLERDGLLTIVGARTIELSVKGRKQATTVMRKHRMAERLLLDQIKVPWADIHEEACRWEHVISDDVEERIAVLLDGVTEDPFGNPVLRVTLWLTRKMDRGEVTLQDTAALIRQLGRPADLMVCSLD